MAKQRIRHGAEVDALTPAEAQAMFDAAAAKGTRQRVRAPTVIPLDATGGGTDEVYTVPPGFEFEVRRITLDLDTATDPSTGSVPLNVAGRAVEYLRSGTRIEYGSPLSPNGAAAQVPGAQTWGAEQGPYLRNGEVFEVRVRGLTAGSRLSVTCEGILTDTAKTKA